MMPTALAIVSAVYPDEEKGAALGILAGASAFFAALGPVLGGVLTAIDWRLVFLVNVPLAIITIVLTSSGIALLGALVTFVLVRKSDRLKTPGPGVFSRRSRWIATGVGRSPAISRRPAPRPGESATG
jgi:MFS family permease